MQWHSDARLLADGALSFSCDAGPLDQVSPVDLLIASVATCFVKSVHMVQAVKGQSPSEVSARVTGEKAPDSPNRVAWIEIRYEMPGLDPVEAAKLAKDAKRICTVSNSLSCDCRVVD